MDFDIKKFLEQRQAFSEKTFGPGFYPDAILNHIRSEVKEVTADPNDLEEWIDIVLLALDGATRCGPGHSPEEIIRMLVNKQIKNEGRRWPEWNAAEPDKILQHIKD